jgi:hypothetical protein
MFDQPLQSASVPGSAGSEIALTLHPLFDGQAALAPFLRAGILNIALSKIVTAWHNAFNEVTTREADDLFACAVSDGKYYDPIPKGAELIQATFQVQFVDSPEPHAVDITPPHTLKLQHPDDAPRILLLLAQRGFNSAAQI